MFSLVWAQINDWVNSREAGDLRRHRAHYDIIVMNDACSWNPSHAMEDKDLHSLHRHRHGGWWPGHARTQEIGRHRMISQIFWASHCMRFGCKYRTLRGARRQVVTCAWQVTDRFSCSLIHFPWDVFHNGELIIQICKNTYCFGATNNYQIISQLCICHDSRVTLVATSKKKPLWFHWIIMIETKGICKRFQLWSPKPLVEWISGLGPLMPSFADKF